MLGQLEVERLEELIGDDERAATFLEQQLSSIRRRIEARRRLVQQASPVNPAETAARCEQPIATERIRHAPHWLQEKYYRGESVTRFLPTSLSDALRSQGDKPAEEANEPATREEILRKLNHQSGCGFDISVLRERFIRYLKNHGMPGDWLERTKMCAATQAWQEFGKGLVDPLLKLMEHDGIVETRHNPVSGCPRQIRLKIS